MKSKEKRQEGGDAPVADDGVDVSRSERKRRAKRVEDLAQELVSLPGRVLESLPLSEELRGEVAFAQGLTRGAQLRQVRTLARLLRQEPRDVLLAELERLRGSHLRQRERHHHLEHLRDAILNEAIAARDDDVVEEDWDAAAITAAERSYPALDRYETRRLAWHFAATRAVRHSRALFRLLRAAEEESERQARRNAPTASDEQHEDNGEG